MVQRSNKVVAVLLLLVWIGIILGYFVLKGSYNFEGNLVVSEMSFTYTGGSDRSFLRQIPNIKALDLEGTQAQPLLLNGTFHSDDQAIDAQLQKAKGHLTVTMPQNTSSLRLEVSDPSQPKKQQLSVLYLSINPETRINQLKYQQDQVHPISHLSFCLQSANQTSEACLSHDGSTNTSGTHPIGTLELQLNEQPPGEKPLILTLKGVTIPELGIQASDSLPTLQYSPTFIERSLELRSPSTIFIDLPRSRDLSSNQPNWFWSDFDVRDVRFSEFQQTGNVSEEVETSTILSGKVRLKDEVMELQKNQFLIVQSKHPGIRKLRFIQLHPETPVGLQTFISGESRGISVGLYKEFPVQSIEPSWLSKNFSQEAINALLAFIATITAIFLPRLFPEPKEGIDLDSP